MSHLRPSALICPLLLLAAACAAEAPKAKLLFDFEQFDPTRIVAQEATGRVVEGFAGKALEFSAPLGPQWPGIELPAPDGKWDLTGYIAVTCEVQNPGEQPVRVLLQISNPGSNGMDGCSIGSATIDAGKRGTVTTPFGEWHGQAKPLDVTNLVSVRILLDRPGAAHRFLVDNIRAVAVDRGAAEAAMDSDFFKQLDNPLGRGINLGNMLEAPTEGAWGVKLDEAYFKIIADAGFTSVRMPVRWNSRADTKPPYTIDPAFFARVDRALQAAQDAGLRVVMNIHHYEELMADPPAHRDRFVALWEQIAEHYRSAPETVWFELLNEPSAKLDAATWNADLLLALQAVRRTNPERQVVIGPVMWNAVDALPRLELPEDDRHLTATFHYYSPFTFTHQGASWAGPQAERWLGTKWLGSEKEQQAVIRQFDQALEWGVAHRRPIYLGEFGAFSRADMESRVRWTKFIAQQAMERKMGFAYWEFCSGFGAWDPEKGEWREGLLGALVGQ